MASKRKTWQEKLADKPGYPKVLIPDRSGARMTTFWDRVASLYDTTLRSINWTEKQAAIAEGVSGRVLEACCGTGSLALTLRQRGVEVCALDLAPVVT
ncbi:MAG: hypothetical protein JW850_04815 [Thermoflexales bacterium]|nr:hypothetical protein [Thermoflexales bacterium]